MLDIRSSPNVPDGLCIWTKNGVPIVAAPSDDPPDGANGILVSPAMFALLLKVIPDEKDVQV